MKFEYIQDKIILSSSYNAILLRDLLDGILEVAKQLQSLHLTIRRTMKANFSVTATCNIVKQQNSYSVKLTSLKSTEFLNN